MTYFIVLGSISCLVYATKNSLNKLFIILSILSVNITTFLFEYFDNDIYYLYLFLDLDEIYTPIGGEIVYILVLLHSLILFGL